MIWVQSGGFFKVNPRLVGSRMKCKHLKSCSGFNIRKWSSLGQMLKKHSILFNWNWNQDEELVSRNWYSSLMPSSLGIGPKLFPFKFGPLNTTSFLNILNVILVQTPWVQFSTPNQYNCSILVLDHGEIHPKSLSQVLFTSLSSSTSNFFQKNYSIKTQRQNYFI